MLNCLKIHGKPDSTTPQKQSQLTLIHFVECFLGFMLDL